MNLRFTGVLIAFLVVLLGAAAWTATSSQAQTPATQPTHRQSFAQAEIAKPTYTPLPAPTATQPPPLLSLPADLPTNTPVSVAQAVIVDAPLGISSSTSAQAPVNYTGGKLILVDISEQHMYVYEGETLVYSFVASTGMNNGTRTGTFSVLEKIPNAYGATWDIWMPNWLGIYWAGSLQNGIHALPILPNGATLWAGFLGTPISYGCVVLDTYDAQVLYDWAEVGVPVEIQW
jgi:lipoprotein-anchoring transpeptidase ErfK/SrfK